MANTTWNPSDKSASVTLSGSNLIATGVSTGGNARAIDKQVTGKFYWECTCNAITSATTAIGVASSTYGLATIVNSVGVSCGVARSGQIYVEGNPGATIGSIVSGTVCIAYDVLARLIWFRLGAAGNWNASAGANPATGTGGILLVDLGDAFSAFPFVWLNGNGDAITANFGDTAFTGTVPSGFTSGFTAGASPPNSAVTSQVAAEHWLTTNPNAQVTQVALEHWASVVGVSQQAIVTQVALEHWASVANVPAFVNGPIITMIN